MVYMLGRRNKKTRQRHRTSAQYALPSYWFNLTVMFMMPLQAESFRIMPMDTVFAQPKGKREMIARQRDNYTNHRISSRLPTMRATKGGDEGFSIKDISKRSMTSSEMVAMTGLGALVSLAVVYSLATTTKETAQSLELVTENVLDAMLPSTASDLVSVTLGEALAGVIGAGSTFVLSTFVSKNKSNRARPALAKDALAEGDFFLASAAAFPLIQSLGMSPLVSSVLASVFASVPYELVKYGSRQREQRVQEDKILQELLEEQQAKPRTFMSVSPNMFPLTTPLSEKDAEAIELAQLENKLDLVEIFSDLIRWLEYGILVTDFGGSVSLIPGFESAIYGVLATISSQVYGDLLYGVFGFGGERKRDLVRSRTSSDWFTTYLSRALYAATLFGVYDAAQIPAKRALNAFLSGSVTACQGSVDYNLCTESFLFNNPPPGPTMAAQLRALFISLYSLWSQVFDS